MAYDVLIARPVPKVNSLPFYCHPIKLFLFTWVLMLASLGFHISYESYPGMFLPLALFLLSLLSFMAGYKLAYLLWPASTVNYEETKLCVLNITRLRQVNLIYAAMALAIIILNLKIGGFPPAFGFFSFDTATYLEYGRLKQILFPLLVTCFVNAFLDPSIIRKSLLAFFAMISMFLYVTRGNILTSLLQAVIIYSMMSTLNKRKIYGFVIGLSIVAGVAINALGNARTPAKIFLAFLQIKQDFWNWPMPCLWIISYFSTPISNMCWIVKLLDLQQIGFSFLYPVLPAFWTPQKTFIASLGDDRIVDGVHTYLSSYYSNFGFVGIVIVNLLIGIGAAYIVRRGLNRFCLTSAIFLGCVGYIFFVDNFMPLSTILQFGMQAFAQWYFLCWMSADIGIKPFVPFVLKPKT